MSHDLHQIWHFIVFSYIGKSNEFQRILNVQKSRLIDLDEVIALSQIPIRTLETIALEMKF